MDSSIPSSYASTHNLTPNSASNSRFTSQASTTEDRLKSETVGLVHLSDFRKRRAEALELKEREAHDASLGRFTATSRSGTVTPSSGASTPQPLRKKPRKNVTTGKLSFGIDDEEKEDNVTKTTKGLSDTPGDNRAEENLLVDEHDPLTSKRRLGPNLNVALAPKVMTKLALLREAQARDQLRKEFISLQESVKATEIVIPFVFYDGTNTPGGLCKVKKGDCIWLFLERSRKVGAELGVRGGSGEKVNSRREWARVGVDDLMLVRGEVIIPHHYEFYYFIVNKAQGPNDVPLFDYSAQATSTSGSANSTPPPEMSGYDSLTRPSKSKKPTGVVTPLDSRLEGYNDDPNQTKVVDRRWYERNKHIFPASVWEQFDPGKDYSRGIRKDAEGNAFFFS